MVPKFMVYCRRSPTHITVKKSGCPINVFHGSHLPTSWQPQSSVEFLFLTGELAMSRIGWVVVDMWKGMSVCRIGVSKCRIGVSRIGVRVCEGKFWGSAGGWVSLGVSMGGDCMSLYPSTIFYVMPGGQL
jgi:hypothetical protein